MAQAAVVLHIEVRRVVVFVAVHLDRTLLPRIAGSPTQRALGSLYMQTESRLLIISVRIKNNKHGGISKILWAKYVISLKEASDWSLSEIGKSLSCKTGLTISQTKLFDYCILCVQFTRCFCLNSVYFVFRFMKMTKTKHRIIITAL